MNVDDFGVKLSEGASLSTLKKGQGYFSSIGINIVRYNFTIDSNKTRVLNSVNKRALKRCVICDRALYHSSFERDDHIIRQKKMLVFVDNAGNSYPTCYKLNSCLNRAGFSQDSHVDIDFKMPTFLEFIELSPEDVLSTAMASDLIDSAETSYNFRIVPFVSKWLYKPIDKSCVSEFLNEYEALSPHFVYYDEDEIPHVKEKILNIIGVTV